MQPHIVIHCFSCYQKHFHQKRFSYFKTLPNKLGWIRDMKKTRLKKSRAKWKLITKNQKPEISCYNHHVCIFWLNCRNFMPQSALPSNKIKTKEYKSAKNLPSDLSKSMRTISSRLQFALNSYKHKKLGNFLFPFFTILNPRKKLKSKHKQKIDSSFARGCTEKDSFTLSWVSLHLLSYLILQLSSFPSSPASLKLSCEPLGQLHMKIGSAGVPSGQPSQLNSN